MTSISNKYTVPCTYGDKCTREVCTFAHSLEELQIKECMYGYRCNRIHGTKNYNTGILDTTNKCYYIHPNENKMEYYVRTGYEVPNLPKIRTKKQQIPNITIDKTAVKQVPKGSWVKPVQIPQEEIPKGVPKELVQEQTNEIVISVSKEKLTEVLEIIKSSGIKNFKIEIC